MNAPHHHAPTSSSSANAEAGPSSPRSTPPPKHHINTGRPANACSRCKGRKIKCSYERPSCAACHKASASCEYPADDRPTWDYVRKLEARLGALEAIPPPAPHPHPSPPSRKRPRTDAHTSPGRTSSSAFRTGPPSSAQALDRLPSALDLYGLRVDPGDTTSTLNGEDNVSLGESIDIPGVVEVTAAADHWFALVNPAYLILHEPTVREEITKLDGTGARPSTHTLHTFYILLAVHAIYKERQGVNPTHQRYQARGFWEKASACAQSAWSGNQLNRLQGLLLRLQYVLRDPDSGDIWDLVGRAVRSAVDLGLHHDPADSIFFGVSALEIDMRRRLFWTTIICDRKISVALGRPLGLHNDWIGTKYPSTLPDTLITPTGLGQGPADHAKECTIHHINLRNLQSEIHERLTTVSAARTAPPPPEWFDSMRSRLETWRAGYTPVPGEYLNQDWLDLQHSIVTTLLCRPSPGNQKPNRQSLVDAVQAAGNIIRVYKRLWRAKVLNFIWLAIHHIFFAGVTVLNSIWLANSEGWAIIDSYIDAILDIQTCSQLLEAMSARERGTESMRDAFETVSVGVIRYLSSQAAPVAPAQSASAFANFDFSSLFASTSASAPTATSVPAPTQSATGPIDFGQLQPDSSANLDVDAFNGAFALDNSSHIASGHAAGVDIGGSSADVNAEDDPSADAATMTVPNAVSAIDRFFSNPFHDFGAVNDIEVALEGGMRAGSSASAKRTAILDQAFRAG